MKKTFFALFLVLLVGCSNQEVIQHYELTSEGSEGSEELPEMRYIDCRVPRYDYQTEKIFWGIAELRTEKDSEEVCLQAGKDYEKKAEKDRCYHKEIKKFLTQNNLTPISPLFNGEGEIKAYEPRSLEIRDYYVENIRKRCYE